MDLPYTTDELRRRDARDARGQRRRLLLRPADRVPGLRRDRHQPAQLPGATSSSPSWPWGAYLGEEALQTGVRVDDVLVAPDRPEHDTGRGQGVGPVPQLAAREDRGRQAGFDEAILLNEQGFLADGSGENVFVVARRRPDDAPDDVVLPAGHHARDDHADRARHGLHGAGARRRAHRPVPRRRGVLHRAPRPRSRRSARSTITRSARARSRSGSRRRSSTSRTAARRSRRSTSTSRPWRPRTLDDDAHDRPLGARRRGARGGAGARGAALGHARARPVPAPLRARLRRVHRDGARDGRVERYGGPAPRGAHGRDRPRRRGDHVADELRRLGEQHPVRAGEARLRRRRPRAR